MNTPPTEHTKRGRPRVSHTTVQKIRRNERWKHDGSAWDEAPSPAAVDDGDDVCRRCGEANDDGEGWDGLCGNCADIEAAR